MTLAAFALLCLAASGCGLFHKKGKFPQPVPPAPATGQAPQSGPLTPALDTLPETLAQPPAPTPPPPAQVAPPPADEPEPAVPKPERKPPAHRVTPRVAVEPPAEAAPPAPPPKPPEIQELAPMMSEQEMRDLNRAIDAALSSAEQNLRAVRLREKNTRQQSMQDQADAFVRQARETRSSDPTAAKSLAERADQLSRELVSTYR